MIKVLGLGDNVVDKYMHTKKMYPGGNALNFSVYSKLMGMHSEYLGVFGDDEPAKHVYSVLKSLDIPMSHCRYYCGENGYAKVAIKEGDRIFIGSNKGGVAKNNPIIL
ncbi:PfkB family carbohydrate kinase [Defluviitalea phaphyphila]|uniref:PfkB family carbohydrate kinase n=1 Tax=Defluviitalea phaphyphila TaxID=1473580 RepID=UPI000AD34222|nr:PfkB family carbohydrate kinase [Defluviitalea phaphyphila]